MFNALADSFNFSKKQELVEDYSSISFQPVKATTETTSSDIPISQCSSQNHYNQVQHQTSNVDHLNDFW